MTVSNPEGIALTPLAGVPYKPHATANGEAAREADLSTQQAGAQAPSRFSRASQDQGWPQRARRAACAGAQAAQRLKPARTPASAMQRLRQRKDFLAAATGVKVPVSGFVLQARDRREDGPVRVGFTVSRKVGSATERNRVRRRLRQVVRLAPPERMQPGHDYVLIGRRTALHLPFDRLIEDFDRALGQVHASHGTKARRAGGSRCATPHSGIK